MERCKGMKREMLGTGAEGGRCWELEQKEEDVGNWSRRQKMELLETGEEKRDVGNRAEGERCCCWELEQKEEEERRNKDEGKRKKALGRMTME